MKLEIKNLSKTYVKGKPKSLDNLSTEFTSGVYGILGPNGAGKSTLMNIIADNIKADSGEVLYNGENIIEFTALTYSFPDLETVRCSTSNSNCCFLTCTQNFRRQVRWSGIPISLRIYHSLL